MVVSILCKSSDVIHDHRQLLAKDKQVLNDHNLWIGWKNLDRDYLKLNVNDVVNSNNSSCCRGILGDCNWQMLCS